MRRERCCQAYSTVRPGLVGGTSGLRCKIRSYAATSAAHQAAGGNTSRKLRRVWAEQIVGCLEQAGLPLRSDIFGLQIQLQRPAGC